MSPLKCYEVWQGDDIMGEHIGYTFGDSFQDAADKRASAVAQSFGLTQEYRARVIPKWRYEPGKKREMVKYKRKGRRFAIVHKEETSGNLNLGEFVLLIPKEEWDD